MAFQGDLKTFAFPDLLSWLDGAKKPGRLSVSYGGGERVFHLQPGQIARYGAVGLFERLLRIARLLRIVDESQARMTLESVHGGIHLEDALAHAGATTDALRVVMREDVYQTVADLLEDSSGSFYFSEDQEQEGEEAAQVDIGLSEVLYEAARRLDEGMAATKGVIAGDIVAVLPGRPPDGSVVGLPAAALAAVGSGSSVGAVRLALGLSRLGAARILCDLWRAGFLRIDGAVAPKPDPLTSMLRQGEALLAQGHYEAASLVFNSLLTADPSDRRVRDFARAVEREHVESIYRKLTPVAVPELIGPESSLAVLRPDERIVGTLVNGKWDVSTLVLASPLRELQTLRAIERMMELGLVGLR